MRRQSSNAKAAQLQQYHTANAIRTLRVFLVKIRDEVFTFAFTDIDRAFGEQPEHVLEGIYRSVNHSLKEVDFKWFKGIEKNYKNHRLRPEVVAITKPDAPIDDLSLKFVAAIRDETLDMTAQYVKDFLKLEHAAANFWVNSLVNRPSLDPKRIIEDLRNRRHIGR